MREYKILFLFILLIILFPTNVNGLACSNQEMVKLKSLAQNITSTYDYVETNNQVSYNITFANLNPSLYIVDIINKKTYYYSEAELTLFNYQPDSSYKFRVYSNNSLCDSSSLYTLYVNLPPFNKYYSSELCLGIENYDLCKKWSNVNITYEEFQYKIEKYKETIKEEEKPNVDKKVKGIFDYIKEFYISYYYFVLPIIIISSVIYIYRKNKKNDLF